MVSREHKRAAFHEKLQLLRSITHSHAVICSITHHFPFSLGRCRLCGHDCNLSILMMQMPQGKYCSRTKISIQVARMDAQMVKQAVLQAIKTGTKSSDQE
ncbi:hypothetical protein BHM03_00001439 [Ensete ventricosum]|nr:hypothetical protein BHM03_00001439 [Ensete ventricosum]